MDKRTRGLLLVALGAALLLGAAVMLAAQRHRDRLAGETSSALVRALQSGQCTVRAEPIPWQTDAEAEADAPDVPEEPIAYTPSGYAMIATLRIDALSIELPVLSEWSDALLDVAPCRYSGSLITGDLVVLGHSYRSHLRALWNAEPGMQVELTDGAGYIHRFIVAEIETVSGNDGEALPSEYPLTIFTCTADSRHRVLVRCTAADTSE